MRFLLTFHSDATGEWRCLDTARLRASSGRVCDLPDALRQDAEIVLRWLVGRFEIADLLLAPGDGVIVAGQAGRIAVYPLAGDMPVIGMENEYRVAWLEIFRLEYRPLAELAVCKPQSVPGPLVALANRAIRPLDPVDDACRATVGKLTDYQRGLTRMRDHMVTTLPAKTEKV